MDVSSIAKLSTALSTQKTDDAIDIKMAKKTLDIAKTTAQGLLDALPPVPANPNVGRNINTTA